MPRTASQTPPKARRSNGQGHPKSDARPLAGGRDGRSPGNEQSHTGERNDKSGGVEVTQSGSVQRTVEDATRSDRLEQPEDRTNPATDADAFAPVLAAWSQMFTPMMEFAGAVVQMQQKTFAAMIAAANTNAGHTRDDDQGNHLPGQINDDPSRSGSRTSTPRKRVSRGTASS